MFKNYRTNEELKSELSNRMGEVSRLKECNQTRKSNIYLFIFRYILVETTICFLFFLPGIFFEWEALLSLGISSLIFIIYLVLSFKTLESSRDNISINMRRCNSLLATIEVNKLNEKVVEISKSLSNHKCTQNEIDKNINLLKDVIKEYDKQTSYYYDIPISVKLIEMMNSPEEIRDLSSKYIKLKYMNNNCNQKTCVNPENIDYQLSNNKSKKALLFNINQVFQTGCADYDATEYYSYLVVL